MFRRTDDGYGDSGADTAESECCRMSSSDFELKCSPVGRRQQRQQQQQQLLHLLMNLHLLANPGDSLLLQHTLDRLVGRLCPSLRIFHVSERASPLRNYPRLRPVAGYPSLAITFFLHEAYGEERILRVLDFLQRPPWQYHHTESCGRRTGAVHIGSGTSPSGALLQPYLLPSRDFYSLGVGMPVWGVRPVHCGGEILRVTLYSAYDNYEDAVRFYETVLQRRAEEQKTGFCWFNLHNEPGLCLQLALKQLSAGVRVEPCSSAVLQFSVDEVGQLVPLLPNPCTPISATRWQTEDLDGNKVLFQVKAPPTPHEPLTCAFPLSCPTQPRGTGPSACSLAMTPPRLTPRQGSRPRSDPALEKLQGGGGGAESLGSGSSCSTPPGSSCYSSLRSSPALLPTVNNPESPLRPSITRSLSHLLLEEDEEEPETNVDTGVPVCDTAVRAMARSSSADLLMTSERPAAVGGVAKELMDCLKDRDPQSSSWGAPAGRTVAVGQSSTKRPLVDSRTIADLLSARTNSEEPLDEFFI